MADYKDIIAGTLNTIFTKAKDVADSVAGTVAESGSVKEIYEQGASKAKAYGRIAKLTLELNGEGEELKKVFAEIGRLYYEQNKEQPGEFFEALFAQADEVSARMAEKEAEIQSLKEDGAPAEADIDVEIEQFEDVVEATENDGAAAEAPTEENKE